MTLPNYSHNTIKELLNLVVDAWKKPKWNDLLKQLPLFIMSLFVFLFEGHYKSSKTCRRKCIEDNVLWESE